MCCSSEARDKALATGAGCGPVPPLPSTGRRLPSCRTRVGRGSCPELQACQVGLHRCLGLSSRAPGDDLAAAHRVGGRGPGAPGRDSCSRPGRGGRSTGRGASPRGPPSTKPRAGSRGLGAGSSCPRVRIRTAGGATAAAMSFQHVDRALRPFHRAGGRLVHAGRPVSVWPEVTQASGSSPWPSPGWSKRSSRRAGRTRAGPASTSPSATAPFATAVHVPHADGPWQLIWSHAGRPSPLLVTVQGDDARCFSAKADPPLCRSRRIPASSP